VNTVYGLILSHQMPAAKIGNQWRIPVDVLTRWVLEKCGEPVTIDAPLEPVARIGH
jgi:excisionase family DNA binding protein